MTILILVFIWKAGAPIATTTETFSTPANCAAAMERIHVDARKVVPELTIISYCAPK